MDCLYDQTLLVYFSGIFFIILFQWLVNDCLQVQHFEKSAHERCVDQAISLVRMLLMASISSVRLNGLKRTGKEVCCR